ncbi:MAG: endonuclease III [Candidatus Schekmanbacteria bacterium RBG_13_48_7]|uniref:Endonuclease III n=1 Tax=Candidatus Schekmanbacteria bacterium RBG_13_48_7 TaxID=1817878 RepID=A0A1F7RRU2_9BACT|nr:MAG: endonuclease III [Candidatus Schekmanbacteria bacterium RBG_13_48_7]
MYNFVKTEKNSMKESMNELQKRVLSIIDILKKTYPGATTALLHKSPLQLLVATILSAQCTDERVNKVTPALFKKYLTAKAFAETSQEELENDIRSTGFFRNKAKSIRNCCKVLHEQYNGKVPDSMELLVKLPGIGRKTANVVLGNAFGQPAITVDTHVKRLSQRLKFTGQSNPDKIEFDLQKIIPEKDWLLVSESLILHGRNICHARKPNCVECPINKLCPSSTALK